MYPHASAFIVGLLCLVASISPGGSSTHIQPTELSSKTEAALRKITNERSLGETSAPFPIRSNWAAADYQHNQFDKDNITGSTDVVIGARMPVNTQSTAATWFVPLVHIPLFSFVSNPR